MNSLTDHPVLTPLHWPDMAKLGVVQWSVTDNDTFTSTVASLQRTDDSIRARVMTRDIEGQQQALFCAVWAAAGHHVEMTHHQLHGADQALDDRTAMATFQDYVNTIGQRPRFTYAGDASTGLSTPEPASTSTAPATIPRTLRF